MPGSLAPRALRAARRLCEVLDLYSVPVAGPRPPTDPRRFLEEATADVLTQMGEAHPQELDERKLGMLLERLDHPADRTLVIRDETGQPCGYCHVTVGDTENARIRYAVPVLPQQCYLWDDQVFVAHRRRGLHAFSIARRLELLAEEGRTEALTIISRRNLASRTSYAAFGASRRRVLLHLPLCRRTVALPTARRVPG